MLFMGQEFAASSPFLYFADHDLGLAELVHKGRQEFLAQFRSLASPEVQDALPRPDDPSTFEQCKLDFTERQSHAGIYEMHRDLLEATPRRNPDKEKLDATGAVLDGRDQDLLQWITDSQVCALCADNYAVEGLPAREALGRRPALPLHQHCLFKLGVPLAELLVAG